MRALDTDFNKAVLSIANKLVPSYDISDNAPNTYKDMVKYFKEHGKLCIYNGASDKTIFADSNVNIAFRAWHDYYHLTKELQFTDLGEYIVSNYQATDIMVYCLENNKLDKLNLWLNLLDIEINEQVQFFNENNYFIEDQYKFTLDKLKERNITICN